MRHHLTKFIIFGGGSTLGAAIDYILTLTLHSVVGLSPSISLALSMVVSSCIVFIYHERITFRTFGQHWQSRYAKFILLTLVVLGLRIIVLDILLNYDLAVPLAVAIALVVVSIVNFAVSSTFVFLRRHD